ncbi:shikimate dehydrogenase [Aliifodinibius salicampi]|uniref:Shikimate dehydrogenase (NADP(+)) n=1 Tax=Fodinibius salicampi TaxID=1920655 RepID=A0ABT3PW63_9BACT|nr:shikimate dehydrogenase [Fodinibius salicampi]MCW9712088.1 shikimate dehydrogenase [Fodinibius salicampi]
MNLTSFLESQEVTRPHYVLFGNPVEHSLSPLMHNLALEYYDMEERYHAVELQSNELSILASYLNKDTLKGANITIPYKQKIAEYLDEIDSAARAVGAVNTIVKKDYRLKGYNTDVSGFLAPLEDYLDDIMGGRSIIFGTGGASRALVTALSRVGMEEIYLVSRKPARINSFNSFENVQIISYPEWNAYGEDAILIVNATPLGMAPRVESSPVGAGEQQYLQDSICYDIVYNPLKTTFLKQAETAGAETIGGLEMLIEQGSRSFEYWTGNSFPLDIIRERLYGKLEE